MPKKKVKLECYYCSYFPSQNIVNKDGRIKHCSLIDKDIRGSDEICEYFRPYEIFECIRDSCRLHIMICIGRQKNNRPCSKRCSQKKIVNELYNRLEL